MGDGIQAEYERRKVTGSAEFERQKVSASRYSSAVAGVIVLGLIFGWRVVHEGAGPQPLAVIAVAGGGVAWLLLRARSAAERQARLVELYDRGLDRLSGEVTQSEFTGSNFAEPGHLYERDLNVLGSDSMFGLLATTRTSVGQRALARMLLHPADAVEVVQRQKAVQELAPNLDLRERVALLGRSQFEDVPAASFDLWLDVEQRAFPVWVRPLLWLTSVAWVALLIFGLQHDVDKTVLLHNVEAIFAVQLLVALWFRARVQAELEPAARLLGQLAILRSGLKLLRESSLSGDRLRSLQTRAAGEDKGLAQLERRLIMVQQRSNEFFYVPSFLLCVGTQAAISLNIWKLRYAEPMRLWVSAWAEFETMLAVATYAVEHAENVYPAVVEGAASFDAEGLAHPLLRASEAVRNDVRLDAETRFLLISGSNMAGKSTLLRAIGCNVVLAMMGAPVCARSLTMSALRVGASLALVDSLAEGKSKFLAEVERLRDLVALAQGTDGGCLFLIDEIFSGTNSADRRAAAEAVLRALVEAGAIGALSTHDLALAELAEMPQLGGRNVHMASANEGDPLGFDYLLKDGVNRSTNAMAIVRMLGLGR